MTLDIHSRVALLDEPVRVKEITAKGAPLDAAASVDRPVLRVQRISTTTRVPVNRVMLVGGMTFDDSLDADAANLYLYVKVSVQELRDDIERTPPNEAKESQ
ncbi:MAG: hypothetical protein IH899_14310 [Planctomycetes bacterium]|nr:hypothetical protein [Planctomycetota bacterium]